jgi:class III cytochrome C family protein/cytochrome c7-like protein
MGEWKFMDRKRSTALVLAALTLLALLDIATRGAAQQSPAAQPPVHKTASASAPTSAKHMVPDNPSPHPAPEQPIRYSHKQHLAFGLKCQECHTNPEPGKLMTFPDTAKCTQCHVTIAKDKASIQKIAQYAASNQQIPWVRVYKVIPGVNWTHRAHLAVGVKCETCHGDVSQLSAMSEVTSVVTMYSCLNCHEMNHAKTTCETCHVRPSFEHRSVADVRKN